MLQKLPGALPCGGMFEAVIEAMKIKMLRDRAGTIEGPVLGNDAHVLPRAGGLSENVDIGDQNLTRSRPRARRANSNRSGLAGSIGSQDPERLAASDHEADRIERNDRRFRMVDFPDAVEFDHSQAVLQLGLIGKCVV